MGLLLHRPEKAIGLNGSFKEQDYLQSQKFCGEATAAEIFSFQPEKMNLEL